MAVWRAFITVVSLDHSLRKCVERSGAIIEPAREMGDMGRMCVIRDPAGAVCALFEPAGGTV